MSFRLAARVFPKPVRRFAKQPFLIEPKFVVIGTGRSGTAYIASLLTAGGIRTGHEGWWNPIGRRMMLLQGDASWCATFELDDYSGRVFHQIRDPLLTMRSVAAVEVAPHRRSNAWFKYRTQYVDYTGNPIVDALLTVDRWLLQAERISEWTWRLEDVNPDLVVEIGRRVGIRVNRARVEAAFPSAQRNEKSERKLLHYDFGWDDLPAGQEKERVIEIARRYGYQ